MFDLNEISIFHRVVREGSFTRAATTLNLPKSTVSERVARLEERLGVRLLERTTRSLRVTEAGRRYFERASRIVAEAEEADAAAAESANELRGSIRVCAPLVAARALFNQVISDFLLQHPGVEVELIAADRPFDLVAEGFDAGIHVFGPMDPTWVVRRLGPADRVFVASPAYVARKGHPREPDELDQHDLVVNGAERRVRWPFRKQGETIEREVNGRYSVTSVELAMDAAERSVGISVAPLIIAGPLLDEGRLVRVLEEWTAGGSAVSLVYPSGRHVSNRLRRFLDHMIDFAERYMPGVT